jgi:CheY-like chemotaxis protein
MLIFPRMRAAPTPIPDGCGNDRTFGAAGARVMKQIIIAQSIMHFIRDSDTIFKRGNIGVLAAATCEEMLNMQGVRKSDLVVIDASMPVMGGVKLCAALRGKDDLRNVSIILAVDDNVEAGLRSSEARANAVIRKPVDPIELFSRISELLIIPQRKDLRVLLRAAIDANGKPVSFLGMSLNISISGMLLETDMALRQGERFSAIITISHRECAVDCQVVRAVPAGKRFQYGVKFVNMDTKTLVILDQFVKGSIGSRS